MTSEKEKVKKSGKILCGSCKKVCKGSVLKVSEKYFHLECFKCYKCKCSLAKGGFFCKDNRYFCSKDYQTLYGTKCAVCKQFVQGEVVTALGKTYHQKCFACGKCNKTFVYGQKVIYTKNQCVCADCAESPEKKVDKVATKEKIKKDKNNNQTKSASLPLLDKKIGKNDKEIKNSSKVDQKTDKGKDQVDLSSCAGCKKSLSSRPVPIIHQSRSTSRQKNVHIQDRPTSASDNTTLFALNRHWHEQCFRCSTCETPLFNKEYMTSKPEDGEKTSEDSKGKKLTNSPEHQMTAHCMTCYKAKLSVRCSYCSRIIEGKVLQAGDDLHFHPTCCRCFKCGFLFTHAQEMFVQGKAIWHAQCEGLRYEQLESHLPRTQGISPVLLDHHHKLHSLQLQRERGHTLPTNMSPLSTMHSYSYLTSTEPNVTYLRKPLQPQNSNSPQYHLPNDYPYRSRSNFSRSSSATRSSPNLMSGMRAMVDSLRPHYRSISPSERSIRRQQLAQANKQRKIIKTRMTSTNTTLNSDQIDKDLLVEKDKTQVKQDQDNLSDENPPSDNSSQFRQQLLDASTDEVIDLSHYPPARRPSPDEVVPLEDELLWPAPAYGPARSRASHRSASSTSGRRSTSRTRVVRPATTTKTMNSNGNTSEDEAEEEKVDEIDSNGSDLSDPMEVARKQHMQEQLKREEMELNKLGRGIGQVFLTNLKEREKRLRDYRLDPRNASRAPSARVEVPRRLRYDNPVNASPSRDLDHYDWGDEQLDQYSLYRGTNTRSSNYTTTAAPYNIVSQRNVPKPGYSLKKDNTNYAYNNLEKTQSIDFNCGKSDISAHSELDRNYINRSISIGYGLSPYSDLYRASLMRNSMPNVSLHKSNEPPKLYPYHLLIITNYRLPEDVDRCHLEAHLSNEEFEALFQMSRLDFYRLPEWKRNELKKNVKLF